MRKQRLAPYLWILAAALAGHALLPFLTLVVSDDWFTLLAYREASLESAWTGAVFLSMPLTVLQSLPFFLIGDSLPVLRAINFLVLWGIGASLFAVLNQLAPSARRENTWVAVIAVVFPGYMVHFMVSFLFYPLGLLLFLLGLSLVLRGESEQGMGRYLRLSAGAALAFYSFHFGALLVAYMLFVAAHLYYRWRESRLGLIQSLIDYVAQRYVFLLLPFWFWLLRQAIGFLLPVWGQYNQPKLDPALIKNGLGVFARTYGHLIGGLLFSPWFVATFGASCAALYVFRREAYPRPTAWKSFIGLAAGGCVLLLGIAPFVLVGKHPIQPVTDPRRYSAFELADAQILDVIDTRMHLFLGIAAGLILVHLTALVRRYFPKATFATSAFMLAVVVSSAVIHTRYYVQLQRRAITLEGVAAQIKESPEAAAAGIVGVVDRIGNVSTTWDSWVLFFESIWGDRKHHGVPERWYGEHLNSAIVYNTRTIINKRLYGGAWHKYFSEPAENASQATLVLGPGEGLDEFGEAESVFRYYMLRLRGASEAREYAKRFATLSVVPKFNLGAWLLDRESGAHWRQLTPARPGDDDTRDGALEPERLNPMSHSMQPGGRLAFSCHANTHGNPGRYLLVEVTGAKRESPCPINIYGSERNLLRTMSVWRGETYVALALLAPGERKVEISSDPEAFLPGVEFSLARVAQQLCGDPPNMSVLMEPYFGPPEDCRLRYRSMLDIPQSLMRPLLWRLDPGKKKSTVKWNDTQLVFIPAEATSKLSTDFVEVQKNAQIFIRIDWPEIHGPAGRSHVTVESDSGTRLLDLKWPEAAGSRLYQVPVSPDTHRFSLVIKGTAGPVQLPSRLSVVQIDDVLSESLPIENYFQPGQ
jgi:hypothetical protein